MWRIMPKFCPSDARAPLPVQSCFMLTLAGEEADVISDEVHAARGTSSRLRPRVPIAVAIGRIYYAIRLVKEL
jgi:hypothetical protein